MIFCFSAQTADESSGLSEKLLSFLVSVFFPDAPEQPELATQWPEWLHFLFRKLGHITEYAILGILWTLTTRCGYWFEKPKHVWRIVLPFCICLLNAVGDEIHQLFVDGRSGELRDVLIDFCGASLGIFFLTAIVSLIHKIRKKKQPCS